MNPTGEAFMEADIIEAHDASIVLPVDEDGQQTEVADLSFYSAPDPNITLKDAEEMLDLESPDCARQLWVENAAIFKHQFGEDGYEVFLAWSRKGKKFVDDDDVRYTWDSVDGQTKNRRPVTIRSLIKRATAAGWSGQAVAKRSYAEIMAWIRSDGRATEELFDQGTQRVARAAGVLKPLEQKSLISALKEKLHERGFGLTIPDIRSAVKKIEIEAAKTVGTPSWAKNLVFVTSLGVLYRYTVDRQCTPEVFNLIHPSPIVGEDGPMRPVDYVLQVVGIPQVENFRYDPSRTGPQARIFNENGVPFVNTYRPSFPPADLEWVDACEEIFQKHLENLIKEPEYRLHVMDFLAYHVQFPGKKIRHACMIQGPEGCGKTFLAALLAVVCGRKNGKKLAGSDLLESNFNDWAYGHQFVAIEEVRVVGTNRYAVMDKVKPLITDDEISLHRKREHHVTVPNITNYLMFTNHHDALAVNEDARRYFVVASRPQCVADILALGMDAEYFDKLYGALRDHPGGFRAMLERWRIDFTRFKPEGRAPMTPYLRDLAASSASPLAAAVQQTLDDQPHSLVRKDLVALDCLRACLMAEGNLQPFTDQALSAVVREAGFQRAGRHSVGGARRQLWVRGVPVSEARRVAEEREELL